MNDSACKNISGCYLITLLREKGKNDMTDVGPCTVFQKSSNGFSAKKCSVTFENVKKVTGFKNQGKWTKVKYCMKVTQIHTNKY